MSHAYTRRGFLITASTSLSALHLWGSDALALPRVRPTAELLSMSPSALLPDMPDAASIQILATAAIDAARQAGASYADIRIADTPSLGIGINAADDKPLVIVRTNFTYGIRAMVNGAMAFVYGVQPTLDAVGGAARNAVASARGLAKHVKQPLDLVPAPVVTGEWHVPVEIDPFSVPLQEQCDLIGGFNALPRRVKYGQMFLGAGLGWTRETRVFASSEGAMITQRCWRANINLPVLGVVGESAVSLPVPGPLVVSGGFECAVRPEIHDWILERTQEVVRLASLPVTTLDVGRYDIVIDGSTMASLTGATLGTALELDRALGQETGASAGSFLKPPDEQLGTLIVSPLVTLTADAAIPGPACVQWDDDGVATREITLIAQGRLQDYFTTRATVGALRAWYSAHGRPVHSNGSSRTGRAEHIPFSRASQVTLQPNAERVSVEDLCRDAKHGVLFYGGKANTDQELTSGMLGSSTPPTPCFEIVNGRIARRVQANAVQFATKKLWTDALKRLGGSETMGYGTSYVIKSQPQQTWQTYGHAPAAYFADIDVVRFGGRS